jgi:hypothetical protein
MSLTHRHTWLLDVLEYWLPGKGSIVTSGSNGVIVGHWKCECGLTKESREYM